MTAMDASKTAGAVTEKSWSRRGFWALIATQFQGAFNDNLFQYLIQFTMVAILVGAGGAKVDETTAKTVAAKAMIIFSLPFLIFPGIAGALSDRLSKQRIAVYVKYWEIFIVCFGFLAFWLQIPWFLWVMLFFMATHSAFFSPAKYGILPEILPENRLSWGNGILQMFTILAIISGTGAAGPLYEALHGRVHLSTVMLLALTCTGLTLAHFITRPPAANPRQRIRINPWSGMGEHFKIIWADNWLLYTVIGYTYFWFAGTLIRGNVFAFASANLALNETQTSVVLVSMALGIGIGALAAGYLSGGKIELGLVPLGTLGLTVFSGLMAWPGFTYFQCLLLLFGLGFFAGFFDVPLAATLQQRSPNHIKGGIMATTNMLTFVGMLVASGLFLALAKFGVSTYTIFLVNCILSLAVGILICIRLPMIALRSLLWIFTNTLYRLRVMGRQHVPRTGGALLVANHTSYIDPLVVLASIDRPVRFLMYRGYYNLWWLRPFVRLFGAIPIAATDRPQDLIRSLHAAGEAVRAGELFCLFAEGEITRTGQLLSFRKGFERIMKDVDAPIIPVHLDHLWGSLFSFSGGRFFWKWPRRIPLRITVNYGAPMPATTSGPALRRAIQDLGTEAFAARKLKYPVLHRGFVRVARRRPWLTAMADSRTPPLSYFKAFIASIILGRKLRALLDNQPMVGILLPPTVGGALTNIALQIMGRIPINLNYTASPAVMASCAQKCHITQCVTARAFLERLPLQIPGQAIYLEDIMATVTGADRVAGLLLALLCPVRLLERLAGGPRKRSQDDLATVIFSSGSEGEPKGVMVTHYNMLMNIMGMEQVVPYAPGYIIMGFLPFFHSFGFAGTLWAPLTHGMCAVYHPNPLEARVIGQLIYKYKAKFLVATSTFLQNFIRRCSAEDLKSLTFVMVGAEKLPPRVRDAFLEKFGIEPLEGYGTTECSPGVSVNIPDYKDAVHHQKGNKRGTVGRPFPGISVRVVDPDTGQAIEDDRPGLLQVKGPNIMKGYLGMPDKTAAVIQDGWYSTGDIASIDEDGFITITDRLARFSKIAGEMISHTKVEETLHGFLGLREQSLAVTGVPDTTRGERLVVLHTLPDGQLEELLDRLEHSDLPNLWRPRTGAFYRIDQIPVLGTGKMDIKAVRALAAKLDLGE